MFEQGGQGGVMRGSRVSRCDRAHSTGEAYKKLAPFVDGEQSIELLDCGDDMVELAQNREPLRLGHQSPEGTDFLLLVHPDCAHLPHELGDLVVAAVVPVFVHDVMYRIEVADDGAIRLDEHITLFAVANGRFARRRKVAEERRL
jgi:hypothetical protein